MLFAAEPIAFQSTDNTRSYDRTLIRAIVIFAYLGWIAYSAAHLLPPVKSSQHLLVNTATIITLVTSYAFFFLQHSPGTFYLYVAFPIYFWHQSLSRLADYIDHLLDTNQSGLLAPNDGLAYTIFSVIALEGMVVRFSFDI